MLEFQCEPGQDGCFVLSETTFDLRWQGSIEALLTLGNGYLGQRAAFEEPCAQRRPGLFVAGTFDCFGPEEVSELPNLPDLTLLRFQMDDQRFSMQEGSIESYQRLLSLRTGELSRRVVWQAADQKRYALVFSRIVSLKRTHILAQRAMLTCLSDGAEIAVESGMDGQVTNHGTQHLREGSKRLLAGGIQRMTATTGQSGVALSFFAANRYLVNGEERAAERMPVIGRRYLSEHTVFTLQKGDTLTVEKVCGVFTSRDANPVKDELAEIQSAAQAGYDALLTESAQCWRAYWDDADIVLDSDDPFDQGTLRFALYHLNIMMEKGNPNVGVAAKGLTGEGYKGHSFWDTEIFILPFFLFTQPERAKTLLEYRYNTLDGAYHKARENGYQGAMYPWESAWAAEGEVTPRFGGADILTGAPIPILTGALEIHISADVAFAVQQYASATGDQDFFDRYGRKIILETARFWASRAEWDEQKNAYVLRDVIGPDEYKEHVDNNAYTNYMAHENMRLALTFSDDAQIKEVYGKLYLPRENGEGIVPQFEGYLDLKYVDLAKYKQAGAVGLIYADYGSAQINRLQVSKQADLLALFLLMEDLFGAEVKKKNYDFYEKRTLHDSSLSPSTHCVLAADLGLTEEAYRFFQKNVRVDLSQHPDTSDDGIHSASMGGLWQCAVYGFGGVRLRQGKLYIEPKLPEQWRSLSFPVVYQGQRLTVTADRQGTRVENRGRRPVSIVLNGKDTLLFPGV